MFKDWRAEVLRLKDSWARLSLTSYYGSKKTNPRLKVGLKVNVPETAAMNLTEFFRLLDSNVKLNKYG